MDEMMDKSRCKGCQHSHDLRGCASHHIEAARNLIAEGKIEEADENLKGLQEHLRE